jgi:hypothetical protein
MARNWITVFDTWAKPISDTEAEKAERAERMIRRALDASGKLAERDVRVFAQGSYKNETNVRQDSDVDIAVCCVDIFVTDYSHVPGVTDADVGNVTVSYTHQQFKNEVGEALTSYFGAEDVARGDKAFDVHANTCRVDADVVACLEYRVYERTSDGDVAYIAGTHIRTDSGKSITNFPRQHNEEGREKNTETSFAFKRIVRILKRLRNEMADAGVQAAKPIASFLIESLVWNVPKDRFTHATFFDDVRAVLVYLYGELKEEGPTKDWCEVNDIKYLFRTVQPWTREQALGFVLAAWNYVGFD